MENQHEAEDTEPEILLSLPCQSKQLFCPSEGFSSILPVIASSEVVALQVAADSTYCEVRQGAKTHGIHGSHFTVSELEWNS